MSRRIPDGTAAVTSLTAIEETGANVVAQPSSCCMATHAPHATGPRRTIQLLEEIAGGQRAVTLQRQVALLNRGSTREQVEEAFQEACLRATDRCHGQTMAEVYVWLRKTTASIVKDTRERRKREVLVDHSAIEFALPDTTAIAPDEALIKREDHKELDVLTRAILDRLCERERTIAILHSHGYQRKEIAERLGLSTRVVKRSVEEVLAAGRNQLAKFTGYGCADGHELVARYAFGLAVGREAASAQAHLATCPRCGAMYERLDVWRERVAALLPVPPVAAGHRDAVEHIVHVGADAVTGYARPRTGLRRHLADVAGHARDQVTAASARAVDPTPLAGARPGTIAAAVAGCIAIGGGATYCVKQSVGPLVGFADRPIAARSSPTKTRTTTRHAAARLAPQRTQSIAAQITPPVATTTTRATTPTKPKPKPLPPSPQDEFEPTSAGATSSSGGPTARAASVSSTSSSTSGSGSGVASTSTPQKPAAAPATGPGEFDGP